MAGRDEPQGPDVDDWFDEPQPPRARRTQATQGESEDDWIGPSTTRRVPRPSVGFLGDLSGRGRAIAVVAVSAVVLLIAILAIAGVFSSSKSPVAPLTLPGSTTATQPTTTQKTTTTSAASVPAPSVPLKPGDTGAQVKVLQAALAALGYDPGKVDGDYGTTTTNAVVAFQKASGLTADGVVGPQTRAALRTALANR
jgi:murein L,D-transpeptidase YcbB/YkuD